MIKLLLFCSLCCLSFSAPVHPLKICVCDVKLHPENGQLGLKFKFFWDDLEATLEKQKGQNLDLRQISATNDHLLDEFVRQNFQLTINGRPIQLRYKRAEIQDVMLIVEWSVDNFQPSSRYQVEVKNQILLDVFPDQYNLVRFDFFGDGNLETLRFEREERQLTKVIVKK